MAKVNLKTIDVNYTDTIDITYGYGTTMFGDCLLATYKDQVCFLGFCSSEHKDIGVVKLKNHWPNSVLTEDEDKIKPFIEEIFTPHKDKEIDVVVQGTDFQVLVWKELLNVKEGSTTTYSDIAKKIGKPKATRPVANAVAKNKVSLLIPCHRIVHKTGNLQKYGWGLEIKERILKYEAEKTKSTIY